MSNSISPYLGAAAALVLCVLVAASAATTFAENVQDEPLITFSLEDASARDVLEVMASLKKLELQIDPDVLGSVTVELVEVPFSMAIDEVCRQVNCEWEIREGKPEVLVIRSTGSGVQRVSLHIVNQPLREAVIEIEAKSGLSLWVAPGVDAEIPVTLQEEKQPLTVVLDRLVAQTGGRWTLRGGVYSLYPHAWDRAVDLPEEQVPGPLTIGLRMTRAGEELTPPMRLTMSWSRPVTVVDLDDQGALQLVMSWLPLGPTHARLLPLLVACSRESQKLVQHFGAVDSSGDGFHVLQVKDMTVEIVFDPPVSWPERRPPPAAPVCGRTEAPMLALRLGQEGESWSIRREIPELPGRFWMVTAGFESGPRPHSQNIGALVYLGRSFRNSRIRQLMVISVDLNTDMLSVQPLVVTADSPKTVTLSPLGGDGPVYTLRVKTAE